MGQPTKRDQQVRLLCENVLAEIAVMRRLMPIHRKRIEQVLVRTGWHSLLDSALAEVDAVNAGLDVIVDQVRAELRSMCGDG